MSADNPTAKRKCAAEHEHCRRSPFGKHGPHIYQLGAERCTMCGAARGEVQR